MRRVTRRIELRYVVARIAQADSRLDRFQAVQSFFSVRSGRAFRFKLIECPKLGPAPDMSTGHPNRPDVVNSSVQTQNSFTAQAFSRVILIYLFAAGNYGYQQLYSFPHHAVIFFKTQQFPSWTHCVVTAPGEAAFGAPTEGWRSALRVSASRFERVDDCGTAAEVEDLCSKRERSGLPSRVVYVHTL